MKIICVVPSFNEEKNIVRVIRGVLERVDVVVVVDDASSDNTISALRLASFNERLIVVRHAFNRGQGASLQTGNEVALKLGADVIVHFDADGQFVVSEIDDLVGVIKSGECDIAIGSRFLGKESNIPFMKEYVILPLGRVVNRVSFGKNSLTDPQSGFRAMLASVAEKIDIEQNRMAHCSEILAKVIKGGFRVKEVPITVIYNEFGQNFLGGLSIVKDMVVSRLSRKT